MSDQMKAPLIVTTTERPAGYEVKQALGQVFGVVVRSRGLGGNIMAGLRSLGGGEIVEYTRLVEDTRRHAIDRMVENARSMGANAVIMMRFDSSEIGQTMSEVVAYGTAAIVEKNVS
ncbi:MAG TPA: heavy metal-binding domain-containing protein [Candidatus Udaeobacter sp.]|nr:heavy metal-binding domain-containing protein [Candidatus Udaeobacter sp.]